MKSRLVREPLEKDDIVILWEWLLHEEITTNLYIMYRPMNMEELMSWYQDEIIRGAHLFIRESVYRKEFFYDGKYHDIYRYGMLKEEFIERPFK